MGEMKPSILVVDDELFNLEILSEQLDDAGYEAVTAENGLEAWTVLENRPERFAAVLLDRMMPVMDGMEVLSRIKKHATLKTLPVIMQTAKAAKDDVLEGLQAGAHYYLTKPFEEEQMLAIVKTAVADYQRLRSLQEETAKTSKALCMMNVGEFRFSTLEEARQLVELLANASPDATRLVPGLSELLVNAVEHGNLGITYQDKSRLNKEGIWTEEVEKRLALPENADKYVSLAFERTQQEIRFVIEDQGPGFDWQQYMELKPERAFDNHGRGIAMAKTLSFDRIEYLGRGNRVMASLSLGN